MHEIEAIVREVAAKSGPITDEYIEDTMRRIRTLCVMEPTEGAAKYVTAAREILLGVQARNAVERETDVRTGSCVSAAEDPIWKQRMEALVHALSFYGLQTVAGVDRVHVTAGDLDMKYPVGGTPVQVLTRVIPERQDLKLSKDIAEKILNALGEKLSQFSFANLVRSATVRGPVFLTINRLDFIKLVTLLFTNHNDGWKARKYLLGTQNIIEV